MRDGLADVGELEVGPISSLFQIVVALWEEKLTLDDHRREGTSIGGNSTII